MLADLGDKLTDEMKRPLELGMREVREAVAKRDVALAAAHAEALKKKLREAGAAVYSQTPGSAYGHVPPTGPGPGEARPTGAGPGGKVVDAEYHEKKSS